jgi:hypothetical protein
MARPRALALALLEGPTEAVGLRSDLDDVRAVGNAVEQRLA